MSSNELHITRANYEAYFLMYVDGELTPAQCDAVEAFTAIHPDLQEELDLLLTTRLDAETLSFDKSSLMADSMKQNVIDESLLLYIDDELKGEEKKKMEKQLATDANYQYQHNLLLQTKLSTEAISYPNKAELYRKTDHKVRPIIWYRAAAAAFVLMASGYMWYMNQNVSPNSGSVATAPGKQTKPAAAPSNNNTNIAQAPATIQDTKVPTVTARATNVAEIVKTPDHAIASITHTTQSNATQVASDNRTGVTASDNTINTTTDVAVATQPITTITKNTEATIQQQNINTDAVTTTQPIAYNKYNKEVTGDESGLQSVALETENNKRGSVKGFLRKATRFIERRTGVATTNQNDELLIGAVAIKLK